MISFEFVPLHHKVGVVAKHRACPNHIPKTRGSLPETPGDRFARPVVKPQDLLLQQGLGFGMECFQFRVGGLLSLSAMMNFSEDGEQFVANFI
ncbi:MAG TPA: hypothetical protein VG326_10735 [Tepidisphaeraceae bacterium]|jgi:hypothetical protein|nr:hypothetical protein [Tepidisphaeraceae bacterium]